MRFEFHKKRVVLFTSNVTEMLCLELGASLPDFGIDLG